MLEAVKIAFPKLNSEDVVILADYEAALLAYGLDNPQTSENVSATMPISVVNVLFRLS